MKPPMPAPQLGELWDEITPVLPQLLRVSALHQGEYLPWDQLRHRPPPPGLTARQWWGGVKLARRQLLKAVPLLDVRGEPFCYGVPDPVHKLLHMIDRDAAGGIQMAEEVTNPSTRDRYIVNSLIEESITSSQLEGASTTNDVARGMIRSGRRPTDRSEQMILNNYAAMQFIQENAKRPLSEEMVVTLHRIVTDGTLDDPAKAGRFRESADNVIVEDGTGQVLHVPPAADELPARLEAMCRFANEDATDSFVHPVIRAIILHFWLGYDHPFVDGNGRTARALFYWSMLSQGYWLAEYVSISRILRKAPGKYGRSFLYTESDGNDLTYFILYQLGVFRRAVSELQTYLSRKMAQVRQVQSLLKSSVEFNHRQLALLSHALRHPGHRYTVQTHQRSHKVAYQTARTDLMTLAARGLLIRGRIANAYTFTAPQDLARRLESARG